MKKMIVFALLLTWQFSCTSKFVKFNSYHDVNNKYKRGYWIVLSKNSHYEVINYKRGVRHGVYLKFTNDNFIRVRGFYKNGLKHGEWSYYYFYNSRYKIEIYKKNKLAETNTFQGTPRF